MQILFQSRLAGLWLVLGSVFAGCGGEVPEQESDAGPAPVSEETIVLTSPNVILISIDTQRADRLGSYGYDTGTSPHLDALAAESERYAKAFAPAPWTLASHAGMLTGAHPFDLGFDSRDSALPPGTPTLAGALNAAGYQTAAYVDSLPQGFVGAARGYDDGFETYRHAPFEEDLDVKYDTRVSVDVAQTWIEGRDPTKPFFLFLHTKSVHSLPDGSRGDPRGFPYGKPLEYMERFVPPDLLDMRWRPAHSNYLIENNKQLIAGTLRREAFPPERIASLSAQYDAGVAYADEHLGRLFSYLRSTGLYEDCLIVVTSDHGESFLEHRFLGHHEVYSELIHIPLIVKRPGKSEGRVIEMPATTQDIAPSILSEVGLTIPTAMTGLPLHTIADPNRELLAYYQYGAGGHFRDEFALRRGPWTLVLQPYSSEDWTLELYEATADPAERSPVDDPERIADMHAVLSERIASRSIGEGVTIELDAATLEHLEALGYLN